MVVDSVSVKEECLAGRLRGLSASQGVYAAACSSGSCAVSTDSAVGSLGVGWSFMIEGVPGIVVFDAPRPEDVSIIIGKAWGRPVGIEVRKHDCVICGIAVDGLVGRWNKR